jgi:hypothetical protein
MAEDQPKKPATVSREELYRQVWETPMQRLAAKYGITARPGRSESGFPRFGGGASLRH